MSESKHTPTPWQVNCFDDAKIDSSDGERDGCSPIADCTTDRRISEDRANAAFIVTACNAHEANVARIAELEAALEQVIGAWPDVHEMSAAARAALARVS